MALEYRIGGQDFPLRPGSPPYLRDPIADAFLDFFAFCLNDALNVQLAAMSPKNAEAVPTDVPTATPPLYYRHAYDPDKMWPQNPRPSLYVWRKSDRVESYTTLKEREVATYGVFYVAQSLRIPGGGRHFAGIGAAVSRVLRFACDQGFHPDYGYDGAPLGEQLHLSVGFQGWEVAEMQTGRAEVTPDKSGAAIDFYPIVSGQLRVWTIIEQPIPQEASGASSGDGVTPGNVGGDMTVSIQTNGEGDVGDTVEFMQRYLVGPDGSEDGDE